MIDRRPWNRKGWQRSLIGTKPKIGERCQFVEEPKLTGTGPLFFVLESRVFRVSGCEQQRRLALKAREDTGDGR